MPSFRVVMAPAFVSIFEVIAPLLTLQTSFAFVNSPSLSVFFVVNSVSRSSRVFRSSPEWNWYSGLVGSTPCWRKACMPLRLDGLMMLRASASMRLSSTACLTSRRDEPCAFFTAVTAFVRDLTAFERSAMSASNSASSCRQRFCSSVRSPANSSWVALRFCRSLDFSAASATLCWMSAERESISSLDFTMESPFTLVWSLQKHPNVSYEVASDLPSSSTFVLRSSSRVTTSATGFCLLLSACTPADALVASRHRAKTRRPPDILPEAAAMIGWLARADCPTTWAGA
mmetsp:Transcript_54670/g.122965  ORF Transcript_54670/g.122965 Transcript_54670/m.122965 type:complete len:287 (-) Transcript_54670:3-863(-)